MFLLLALAVTLRVAHSSEPEKAVDTISAQAGAIHASQIADVPRRLDVVLARLPAETAEVQWTEEDRLALVRNRYPGRVYPLRQKGPLRVVWEAPSMSPEVSAGCYSAQNTVVAGSYLEADDLRASPCGGAGQGNWVGYDVRARAFFARRDIPQGVYLGRIRVSTLPAAVAGSEMIYRTSEGPVAVERKVVTLQATRAGKAVFVRTRDDEILAATFAEGKAK